jgi:hypothetical protein
MSTKFSAGASASGLVECGSIAGISTIEGKAPGFSVGVLGAVALAAYDNVGNVGALSSVVCAKPEPVTDFFESYKEAGGTGGNGFYCQAGTSRPSPLGVLAFSLVLAAVVLRRQRGER